MDFNEAKEQKKTIEERIALAHEYKDARLSSCKAKLELDSLLIANLSWIRADKPNCGIDMAYLMLLELCPEAKECYETWQTQEAKYKGLERIINAVESKTTFAQSLMRFQRNND